MGDRPEISDLIVDYDAQTLQRKPVARDDVVERLRDTGQQRAARIVEGMPHTDGVLNSDDVDRTLLRAHRELQRLHEEFQQPRRILELLRPTLKVLRERHDTVRIVDVGCGMGYVVRWLASRGELGQGIELVGCDYNAALIHEASRLTQVEGIDCKFVLGNAFTLDQPAHVYMSTGVIHHFRDEGLRTFFREQCANPSTAVFFHFDIDPSWLAPLGAWLFHRARMREPLARNDGVLSALRAHSSQTLLEAAAHPGFQTRLFRVAPRALPITRVLRPVVGVRSELWGEWVEALGSKKRLLKERA
ncbi:MAG: class I SAM-dependent methyltransferase [Myxococcota bacterium]